MAILMIHGPDDGAGRPSDATLQAELDARAQCGGQAVERYRCASEAQLVERLARIDRGHADIILLDPGRCSAPGDALRRTLDRLDVPYIEVHEDGPERQQPLPAGTGKRVAVVQGYAAQSYTLAMSLALETLGCAECENEFNVGT